MPKSQYKFNPDDINFDKMDDSFRTRFWRVLIYVFGALVLALLINFIYILFFDSPRERQVRRENEELRRQYTILQDRKATVDTVLSEITRTDENIYRLIFETEPADKNAVRNTIDPYMELKILSDRQIVYSNAGRLDSMLEKSAQEKLDYDILRIKSEDKSEMLHYIPAVQPLENSDLNRTASGFGYRIHPIYKILKFHTGMDFTAPVGTPVFATGAGSVEVASRSRRGSGNRIVINHGFGYKTVYEHLNELNTRQGRKVIRGEVIGTVGNTGLSTAPHLHYEVLINDEAVNPLNFYFMELIPEDFARMIVISKKSGQSFD
jgi:murein DD-endopeptidase MepM/ murein hydrolase activator NlpD